MLSPSSVRTRLLLWSLPFALALIAASKSHAWISGYPTAVDVAQGDTLKLHINTNAATYSVWIEDALDPSNVLARYEELPGSSSAVPESAFAWGCGWPVSLSVPVDPGWPSSVYYARLISLTGDGGGFSSAPPESSFVPFVVREDQPGSTSKILFQLSTNTYQAYNAWGGRSLYPQNSEGNHRSYFVSYERPYDEEQGKGQFPWYERPLAAWLRTEGIPVEFCTNLGVHRDPDLLSHYKLFMSVGHDEYWSKQMYDQAEAFREAGGNLAFFSGNSVYWSVRFMGDTMVCYKDAALDPYNALGLYDQVTSNWRYPPLNRPEGRLIGVQFDNWCWRPCGAPEAVFSPGHWVDRGLGLQYYDHLGTNVVGYEWDRVFYDAMPELVQIVFQTTIENHAGIPRWHQASYYQYPLIDPRSRIFGAGTIQWSWGVRPDSAGADSNLVAITRRIVRCLGQPSVTESERQVIFTADLRQLQLEPGNTIWLRGTPPPLGSGSMDFPMLDDGALPDSTAGDNIRSCLVTFPAGTWNIVDYSYWTSGGRCASSTFSAWIDDPDLGPGPVVRLSPDRPDWCPPPTQTAIEPSDEKASAFALHVHPVSSGISIEVTGPDGRDAGEAAEAAHAHFKVAIYDAGGRLVRLVANGVLPPGGTRFLWRGDDERGHRQPRGVYLLRARLGKAERVAKVVWQPGT